MCGRGSDWERVCVCGGGVVIGSVCVGGVEIGGGCVGGVVIGGGCVWEG